MLPQAPSFGDYGDDPTVASPSAVSPAFVDVSTPMLGPDSRPRQGLYLADQLHMTPAGYAIWRARVAPALR